MLNNQPKSATSALIKLGLPLTQRFLAVTLFISRTRISFLALHQSGGTPLPLWWDWHGNRFFKTAKPARVGNCQFFMRDSHCQDVD
jgi:hypothetical protein